MRLTNLLNSNFGKNLFLPAHGRGKALPQGIKSLLANNPGTWDLPELPEIGGPLEESGAIAESQILSAELYGADRCWYGVNGASGLLHAALFSILKPGEAVLMPRNVHKSIINACIIGKFRPVLFDLPFLKDRGHYLPANHCWMKKVLDSFELEEKNISAVVLANPTYQGYSSDLTQLIEKLHAYDLPVLVDEAHGTHFAFSTENQLPKSALKAGADLVVNSLHKSCSGLSQTAVLWQQGDRVDPMSIQRSISIFQTTSPSSLLLASCENSLFEFAQPVGQNRLRRRILEARKMFENLVCKGIPLLQSQDPLKFILHTASIGISGMEADKFFLSNGLIAELPEPGTLTLCLGFARHYGLDRFISKKWKILLDAFPRRKALVDFAPPPIPFVIEPEFPCGDALLSNCSITPLENAAGKISADLICPYPPGIPILIPGERLDRERVDWLLEQKSLWLNQIPSYLRVVS